MLVKGGIKGESITNLRNINQYISSERNSVNWKRGKKKGTGRKTVEL